MYEANHFVRVILQKPLHPMKGTTTESEMKPTFLIFVILGLFYCCWAGKKFKDPDHFLLDGNRAKNFLLHKRNHYCEHRQAYAEKIRENGAASIAIVGLLTSRVSVYEECCREGCNTEEMDENMHPGGFSDHSRAEISRETYVKDCCH
ncbi:uncharacterized protein [Porites lutea]|uniref:uncharacterized protein isoform X2 n=1 Tax=Porites lutea TaxID=51062 RepID=UPI003CC5B882